MITVQIKVLLVTQGLIVRHGVLFSRAFSDQKTTLLYQNDPIHKPKYRSQYLVKERLSKLFLTVKCVIMLMFINQADNVHYKRVFTPSE